MAWQAVHPDNTTTVELPEGAEDQASFEIGFWPPREAERLNLMFSKLQAPEYEDIDPLEHQERYLESIGLNYEVGCQMVAFGLRGWSGIEVDGKPVEPVFEMVEIDGRKHRKLSAESLDFLYVNGLVAVLGLKCWLFNVLTEEQKKTSGLRLPSPSSTNGTGVEIASPDTPEDQAEA